MYFSYFRNHSLVYNLTLEQWKIFVTQKEQLVNILEA